MKITAWSLMLVLLMLTQTIAPATTATADMPRERISLNADWRFAKSDPAEAGTTLTYPALRRWILPAGNPFTTNPAATRPEGEPGASISFAQPGFDDSAWRLLNLPHDWGIEGPFQQEYSGETAKLPWWGVAWYRKHLDVPASDAGKRIRLEVDGAMSYATVWLNGKFAGGWPYGYSSWQLDLTPYLKFGGDNVLAIRLDNPNDSSRWYPGGGIYRNVWLVKTSPVHVGQWGICVTTPEVSAAAATVKIQVSLDNDTDLDCAVRVENEIFELGADGSKGKAVASFPGGSVKIAAHQSQSSAGQIIFKSPRLWSIEKPNRYAVVTSIHQDGKVVDRCETPFGVRTIEFTADDGFLLNGQRVPLHGVCDHHDLGALGTAINIGALARQIRILKEMGCNAIRTSHNPPAPELLELCDRLGMVVMDEAFDCWKTGKTKNDYHLLFADWHEQDLRALVRRDRNHPCVILWSIGNEVPDQGNPEGPGIAHELRDIVHSEDDTRPVTAACDHVESGYNDFRKALDVFGYNYKPFEYGKFRAANPAQPLFGSETSSTVSSRGEYFFPPGSGKERSTADFQVSSYDLYAPPWATTVDAEFAGQDRNPFVAGEFVWTGFDYLGEPTPYNGDMNSMPNFTGPADGDRLKKELAESGKIKVPSRSSYFGIVDLAGFKKDRFYLYQAHWRPDFPMAHILPHWNWPDRVGQVTPVYVYTSGDEAELFLNGKSLGRQKKAPFEYRLRWNDVVYQPGALKVIAYKNGRKWAADEVKTAGTAAKLTLQPDRDRIHADGHDLSFITAAVVDKNGLVAPRAKNHIQFAIEGPGEIVATDNGDATSFESFQEPARDAFNRLALVIVRAKPGQPGAIVLKAESPGLKTATTSLVCRP